MLRYFIRRSKGEQFQKIATPPASDVWVQGHEIDEEELRFLSKKYSLDYSILHDVLDKNELPRVEVSGGATYVFVRSIQRGKHGKVMTTPVLLVMADTVFVNLSAADDADRTLTKPALLEDAFDPAGLLLATFVSIISEYEALIQRTAQYVHDTGQRLRTHEVTNDDFIRFVTVEDNLNEYKMNLAATQAVAERLRETLTDKLHREAIDDVLLYTRQLLVAIDSYNQSVTSIRNAYGTIANNILNQRMKTLTVLTVLIALPNVVYGMYGMNVNLPFQEQPWVYGVIVTFSVSIIFLVFSIGRRRGIF